jgi:curved DNA-binding protein CbpA
MNQPRENYYQVLRVSRKASSTEIVAAYHAAKGAFSPQSLSSSASVLSAPEVEAYLAYIEEAYVTLSDPKKRHDYDQILQLAVETKETTKTQDSLPTPFSGQILKQYREAAHLSLEEVFRITRIPIKFLRAIEEEIVKEMPARVYLQGFVKNLAQVYKLPPSEVARLFLEHFDATQSRSDNS